MFNKSLFSLALIPVISFGSFDKQIATPSSQNSQIEQLAFRVSSIWQRRPRKRNISRSIGVCAIAPGLVDTYIVWSDRPLFLWHTQGKNQNVELTVRDYETQKVLWTQPVNTADQKVLYSGQEALKPGNRYQWQLSGSSNWTAFEIMPANQRQQIQLDLQTLEQNLKANKTSTEEIALKKADYFLNYEIKHQKEDGIFHLWSDALQALYIENPSPSFIQKRQAYVAGFCTNSTANN
ncbi:hypothetical protein IQ247_23265 [Plectonema cf. radiosum LEGE 06105]|uniref:DUF928 domain-containing protein n=1 Tax=Plectonema cf. radiosum LEGE 06105 TaxID=945769 RepID=A0A8J7JV97_9CYAN|nr:hypothetical protein [Plectonema radiosum]MBE9215549.1 hypothetical protein [Plectonema cf. radiosum LEGE 06105]